MVPICTLYIHGNMRISVIYIYFLGAYLRLYGCGYLKSLQSQLKLIVFSYSAIVSSVILLYHLGGLIDFFKGKESQLLALNSLCVILCGIGIFSVFKDLSIGYNKYINGWARTMFGVYLIHDNPLIKSWLWNDMLNITNYYGSVWMVPYAVLSALVILVFFGAIDWLRIHYLGKPVFDKYGSLLEKSCIKLFGFVEEKVKINKNKRF